MSKPGDPANHRAEQTTRLEQAARPGPAAPQHALTEHDLTTRLDHLPDDERRGAGVPVPRRGGFRRITVAGPATRVDLAVPAGIPIASLLPGLLRHAVPERGEDGGAAHDGWVLARADGVRLDPARSLASESIHEGDLLVLHPAREKNFPPLYDDVVEVIGAEAVGSAWGARETRITCGAMCVLLGLGVAAAVAASTGRVGGVVVIVAGVLLLLAGGALSRAAGDLAAGTTAAVIAAPLAAVGAAQVLGAEWGRAHLLLAAAVVLVAAALGAVLVGGGDAVFAALAILGVSGVLGGLVAVVGNTGAAEAASVVAPLALAVTTVLPTLALRLARLPRPRLPRTAEDIAETSGGVDWEQTAAHVTRARALLTGMIAGAYATIATGIAVIAPAGNWGIALATVLAASAALRSRLFSDRAQVLAPMIATGVALAAIIGTLVAKYAGDDLRLVGFLLPVLVVCGLGAGTAAVASRHTGTSPRGSRLLDVAETILLVSVVPLVLAVWNVYSDLLELG